MSRHYYVARITDCGWFRLSDNCDSISEAQSKLATLKSRYPNACVVVDPSSPVIHGNKPNSRLSDYPIH